MQNSCQDDANMPLHQSWKRRMLAIIRYAARKAVYSHPRARKLLEPNSLSTAEAAKHWDHAMSKSNASTYLGHTITVDAANAMTANLISYYACANPSVLDVGCCAASLVPSLDSYSRYHGIDVSPFAIRTGLSELSNYPGVNLEAIDIRDFATDQVWDVITFNEVLYYLSSDEAVHQVERYSRFLSGSGILCIAMKDDPKSAVIFSLLQSKFSWVDGILWQRKMFAADYAIRINREQPAFLLGVFKRS
jgi:2-polyprenyl-3-methyl-5-hydroxy-6-metoxy-1,4-benzoquinol methylase